MNTTIQVKGPSIPVENTIDVVAGGTNYTFLYTDTPQASPNRSLKAIQLKTILDYIINDKLPIIISTGNYYITTRYNDTTNDLNIYTLNPINSNMNIKEYEDGLLVRFLVNDWSNNDVLIKIDSLNSYPLFMYYLNGDTDLIGASQLTKGRYYEAIYMSNKSTYYICNKTNTGKIINNYEYWSKLIYRGNYLGNYYYNINDYVISGSTYYACIKANSGESLSNTEYWITFPNTINPWNLSTEYNQYNIITCPFFVLIYDKNNEFPVGGILGYGSPRKEINDNYLKCDGRSVLISSYPELYSIIGDYYGTIGDKFILPEVSLGTPSVNSFPCSFRILNDHSKKSIVTAVNEVEKYLNYTALIENDSSNVNYIQILFKINLPSNIDIDSFMISFKVSDDNLNPNYSGISQTSPSAVTRSIVLGKEGKQYSYRSINNDTGSFELVKDYEPSQSDISLPGNIMTFAPSGLTYPTGQTNNIHITNELIDSDEINNSGYYKYGWIISGSSTGTVSNTVNYNDFMDTDNAVENINEILKVNYCILEPAEDRYTWNESKYVGDYTSGTTYYNGEGVSISGSTEQYYCITPNSDGTTENPLDPLITGSTNWISGSLFSNINLTDSYSAGDCVIAGCYYVNISDSNRPSDPRLELSNDWHELRVRGNYNGSTTYDPYDMFTVRSSRNDETYNGYSLDAGKKYYINERSQPVELTGSTAAPLNVWNPGYRQYSLVSYNNNYYYHNTDINEFNQRIPGIGTEWSLAIDAGNFGDQVSYDPGQFIKSESNYYLCIQSVTRDVPVDNTNYWRLCAEGSIPVYSDSHYYQENNYVIINTTYRSNYYIQNTYYATNKFNYNRSRLPYPINLGIELGSSYNEYVTIKVPMNRIREVVLDNPNSFYFGFLKKVTYPATGTYCPLNINFYGLKIGYYSNGIYNNLNDITNLLEFNVSDGSLVKNESGYERLIASTFSVQTKSNLQYAYIRAR